MPGCKKEAVNVDVDGRRLTVTGEKASAGSKDGERYEGKLKRVNRGREEKR